MDILGEIRGIVLTNVYDLAVELVALESGDSFLLKECEDGAEHDLKRAMRSRLMQVIEDSIIKAFQLKISETYIREVIASAYDGLPPNFVADEFGVIHV